LVEKDFDQTMIEATFTIFFEDPFWIGILEENYNNVKYMGKYIFGAEPSNTDLINFYLYNFVNMERVEVNEKIMHNKHYGYKKSITKAKRFQKDIGIKQSSKTLFQKAFEKEMKLKEKEKRQEEIIDEREKYEKRLDKKREKKKGH